MYFEDFKGGANFPNIKQGGGRIEKYENLESSKILLPNKSWRGKNTLETLI